MSNLSFARIMYGATQEQSSPALMPISNFPSHLSEASSAAPSGSSSAGASSESFLHKAWQALTRHN